MAGTHTHTCTSVNINETHMAFPHSHMTLIFRSTTRSVPFTPNHQVTMEEYSNPLPADFGFDKSHVASKGWIKLSID